MGSSLENYSKLHHILLTGVPGIGKTTLIKKVCKTLQQNNVAIDGFYTEEIRQDGARIGFDVVTLGGLRSPLARLTEVHAGSARRSFRVGKYSVLPNEFEYLVLPVFQKKDITVLILDEIGKMELFSEKFKHDVEAAFKNPKLVILGTIPIEKGKPIPILSTIRKQPHTKIITVDQCNRDSLPNELMDILRIALDGVSCK